MQSEELSAVVIRALEDLKANDIKVLDVRGVTDVTDIMVIASGTSSRHVQALASNVSRECLAAGVRPLGMEGEQAGDWVLVDVGDVVVHVMLPETRDFYNLERLWDIGVIDLTRTVVTAQATAKPAVR